MRQFWRMVSAKSGTFDLGLVQTILNPEQMVLFNQMTPGEKEHAIVMLHKLTEQGENQPDLLVATLLHDVGKLHYRLNPLERTMVVLAKAVMPEQAHQWGSLAPDEWEGLPGWRKSFIVAEQHAGWGAEMARRVGVSTLTETLIREHHHPNLNITGEAENSLLYKLWVVDNES
jgi:putative nucleotidyltransferase with HDIG domain